MSLPDELKTQILDATVGGIEAFLTCVGCCVVALHPKGRHDKAMREYCLSSEFFEKFIDQWGRRWSRPPSRAAKKSSRSSQPHCPTPNATTPTRLRHKKNDSSSSVQFLPSPQSPEKDMISGASTPGPSAGKNSLFKIQSQAGAFSSPSPASAPSAEHSWVDAWPQPNTVYEWDSFFDSLLYPPENDGYPEHGFDCNNTRPNISTSAGPEDFSHALQAVVPFEGGGVMPRPGLETSGSNIIRPFSNSIDGTEQHERKQAGPSTREPTKAKAQNQVIRQDGHLTRPEFDEVPTIKVVTPSGSQSSPVIYPFGRIGQRSSDSVSSQDTEQGSGIPSTAEVFKIQPDRQPYARGVTPVTVSSSIPNKRERDEGLKDGIRHNVKKRSRVV